MALTESSLDPQQAIFDTVLGSGLGFSHIIKRGQSFRIVDLEGNQAVDTLFYDAADPTERYSAVDTIRSQGGIYLSSGSPLVSTEGVAPEVDAELTSRACATGARAPSSSPKHSTVSKSTRYRRRRRAASFESARRLRLCPRCDKPPTPGTGTTSVPSPLRRGYPRKIRSNQIAWFICDIPSN